MKVNLNLESPNKNKTHHQQDIPTGYGVLDVESGLLAIPAKDADGAWILIKINGTVSASTNHPNYWYGRLVKIQDIDIKLKDAGELPPLPKPNSMNSPLCV